jgi:hypothetical protein
MNAFTISLPDSTSTAQQEDLEAALQDMHDVEGAGLSQTRAIDPATIQIWVKVAGEVIATTAAALPVIEKTVALIRGKGVKGAKITLPGGATLQVDSASADDIRRIVGT